MKTQCLSVFSKGHITALKVKKAAVKMEKKRLSGALVYYVNRCVLICLCVCLCFLTYACVCGRVFSDVV